MHQLTVQKIQDSSSFQPTKKRSSLSNKYAYRGISPHVPILMMPSVYPVSSCTHHYRHARRLDAGYQDEKQAQNTPSRLPQLLASREDDDVRNDRHAL